MPAVPYVVGMTFLVIFAIYIGLAYAKVEIDHLFPWLVMQLGAPLYVGLWGGMNVLMMGNGQGFEHCYPFILVMTGVWLCDTVAYFFGKFAAGKGLWSSSVCAEHQPEKDLGRFCRGFHCDGGMGCLLGKMQRRSRLL